MNTRCRTRFTSGGIFLFNAVGMVYIMAALGYLVMALSIGKKVPFARLFSIYALCSGVTLLVSWIPYFVIFTEPWKWYLIGTGLTKGCGFKFKEALLTIGLSLSIWILFYWTLIPIIQTLADRDRQVDFAGIKMQNPSKGKNAMSKKIKVLMVDDEEKFRLTTKKILDRRGFDTLLAASGEEALERLEAEPDVVVLDIKMPGMDGHQTLQEIRSRSPQTPVIMLTGHGALPSAQEALTHGAHDYLTKPCDIDLLASKITDAYRHTAVEVVFEEKTVREVMIPREDYTTLNQNSTVRDAVFALRESFAAKISTDNIMETGHRSLLVYDDQGKIIGILTIIDLLNAIMPGYLSAPKPSMADSIQYSPMFWSGMFKRETVRLASKKIRDVMSPAPFSIEATANLMEAAYAMIKNNERRLAVTESGEVIGIIREQDLFFEIERILRE
jgi:DNA-binding response OmpR family regulator